MREKKNYFFKARNFSDTKLIKYKLDTKSIKYKPTVIVILRGHIRNSFDNTNLYDYLSHLSSIYKLYIFIHTWNITSNDLSWRPIKSDTSIINENIIKNYFKDINIQKIIIEDENNVELIGNVTGDIHTTQMPIKGWKYMWHGIYKITNDILMNIDEYNLDSNTYTLNIRFDYFTNITIHQYNLKELKNLFDFNSNDILFMKNKLDSMLGIDNIYFGKFYKIYYTAKLFHTNLDYILQCYKYIYNQEKLVFLLQKYINLYCDDYLVRSEYIEFIIKLILTKLRIDYIKYENKLLTIPLNMNLIYNDSEKIDEIKRVIYI